MKELQSEHTATSEDKNSVLEMLQRLEEQTEEDNSEEFLDNEVDSDDSMDDSDLAKRLDEVDLNNADAVWERLTTVEREEFKSMVYNNEIDKIIEPVEPWWRQKMENHLVVDVEENKKIIEMLKLNCPKITSDIKEFSKISSKTPAPCIIYNIANVIGTYTFIFRYYNGDHFEYAPEAVDNFISICDNIKANANYENINTVVDTIIHNCQNHALFTDKSSKNLMLDDLKDIFEGLYEDQGFFLSSALSDIINLFESAKLKNKLENKKFVKNSTKFSSEFPDNHVNVKSYKELQNITHFNNCTKKLEFYQSFLKHCYNSKIWIVEF